MRSWHLGLFWSGYLLRNPDGSGKVSLKQVEFDTILGSSFEMLSYHTAALQASPVTGLRTLTE